MDSMHVFGGVVAAFLFGFVILYSSRGRENTKASEKSRSKKTLKSSGNGACRSNFAGNTDGIIVGAGVAGSALAYALAKDGWRVQVIERDLTEPDRIVGELLHAGGCIKLAELGLEDCLDGTDSQIVFSFAAVHKDGKRTAISYPSNTSGRGFYNGRFIQKLREKAASLPNVKLDQGTVTSLVEENGTIKGVLYKTKAGQELAASASLTIIEVPSYFVGLVLENYNLPYANRAYFILKDTIVIAYPISSNEIRCLIDVPGLKQPPIANGEMASYLKTVVAPQMPPELHNAFICAIEKGNIRTMPNRIMAASPSPTPGAFMIGDSLNMRHAVTGGGMTVGLSDVVLLRDLLRPLNDLSDGAAICKYLESFYILRKPTAFAINTLASTLHTVFSSSDQDPSRKEMKEAFFNYLSLGGVFSEGLMALLSGLNPDPLSLVFHCFAMLAYAVGRLLLPFPTPKRMFIAAKLILVGSGIIFPMLKAEGIRATFFPATMPAYYRTPPVQSTDDRETGK
ncbi:squalene monooxygenase SE1-like [Populus alba x Populus x berolinensis]|nr:squalene monooxygenase SE1-like [Populus alba x Populus x berolinensis]